MISQCKELRSLSLTCCGRLKDDALQLISQECPLLTDITLNGCYMITDLGLCEIVTSHPKLEHLNLMWSSKFTKSFVEDLTTTCHSLKTLQFSHCTQLTDEMINQLSDLGNLRTFVIENSPHITELPILSSANTLEKVEVIQCPLISAENIISSISKCKQIRHLVLDLLPITDLSLCEILENLDNLHSLSLNNIDQISDESILYIASTCGPRLTSLSLVAIVGMTGKGLSELANWCKSLTEVNFSWCRNVNDDSVQMLTESCKKLKKLTLWGCNKVTDIVVAQLLKNGIEVHGKDQFEIVTA